MSEMIEIPFGAKDSELGGWEYTIPEGCTASIKNGKIIVKKEESDDERIRKELIEYIKDQQSSFISAPDCRDKYEEEENNRYNSWIAWLEKQGEKKSEEEIDNLHNYLYGEQKPAWSDEDIAIISRVISIVKWAAYSDHSHPILNDEGATELVEWLKSLKERYTWKPSDAQMKAIGHICDGNYNVDLDILDSIYRDFKKLLR